MKRLLCLPLLLLGVQAFGSEFQIVDLTCDYRETPLAVDRQDPLFSWRVNGDRQELAQQAYRIQVASALDSLDSPDLWDSGWVKAAQSTAIEYAGKPFGSKQRLFWRVQIKDDQGTVSRWSKWATADERQNKVADRKTMLRPPAGRLAIVIDGNSPDPDDIGATAAMFGLLCKAGVQDRLVHLSHSCDLRPTERISKADELRRQQVLHQLCHDGVSHFGPFTRLNRFFNCRQEQEAAVNDLRDAINASAADNPLWIVEAGEPDVIGFALRKAEASKLQHVHVISHHPANDNSGDFFEWAEILAFEIKEHQIGDQNVHLQTAKQPWDWAKKHSDPGIAWIWDRLAYAEQDGVVKFQTNKFDCSDAGMLYWWLTGATQGGEKRSTPQDFKSLLMRE